ncbi:NADH dehydrogenase-like protein [compost metagenome]
MQVRTGSRVFKIDAEGVTVGDQFIPSHAVFWAAGVQAAKMKITPTAELDRAGRVKVKSDFSIPTRPNVFVVGDMASFDMGGGKFLPGLAPAAMQAGRFVAKMILNDIRGKERESFKYVDKGQMATIGKHKAVAQANALRLTGYIAWIAWFYVHILYLVSFKNKFSVMLQWTWNYLFSKRGARLITEREWKLKQ